MSDMLKFDNGTWTIDNIFLVQLLKMTAELALQELPKRKGKEQEKATLCLAMLQIEHMHKTISMVDELFAPKPPKPVKKAKLKLVKPKVEPQ
jgi:hypothetical protein